ncbi:MAG: TIGR00730 family Rossman fold protein [Actinomycetota bacterium]
MNERLPRYRSGDREVDDAIAALIDLAAGTTDDDLLFEMIVSSLRLARENNDRGDLKLINAALKELRYSMSVFSSYRDTRKLSIFGSARTPTDHPNYQAAVDLGAAIVDRGWMVITGGGPGIMAAGLEGAGTEDSFGVGISLPFEEQAAPAIADDPKLINFKYFFTRKLTFMKESHGYALLPGGFGTMDESFELLTLLQTGKTYPAPVVLLDAPGDTYWQGWLDFVTDQLLSDGLISADDMSFVKLTDSVDEAVDEICSFYSTYHSMRFVGRRLILRMTRSIDDAELDALNRAFADIVVRGRIERTEASSVEVRDRDEVALDRIAFEFDRRSYARLRELIDALNQRRQH